MSPQETSLDPSDSNGDGNKTCKGSMLPKKFGMWDGAAHMIGVVIGSGIFISPVVVLKFSVHCAVCMRSV